MKNQSHKVKSYKSCKKRFIDQINLKVNNI